MTSGESASRLRCLQRASVSRHNINTHINIDYRSRRTEERCRCRCRRRRPPDRLEASAAEVDVVLFLFLPLSLSLKQRQFLPLMLLLAQCRAAKDKGLLLGCHDGRILCATVSDGGRATGFSGPLEAAQLATVCSRNSMPVLVQITCHCRAFFRSQRQ